MKTIAAYAHSTRARAKKSQYLQAAACLGYTPAVTSKKGVIGFGSPKQQAAQSRNTAQSCGFFVRAPSFGGSDGEPQGSPVQGLRLLPGLPTRSSCLPRLEAGVAVVHSSNYWRPHMAQTLASTGRTAQIFAHPNLFAPPVQQGRLQGRHPKGISILWKIRNDRSYAAYCAQALQDEIKKKVAAAAEWEAVGKALRYDAAALQSRFQRGEI